MNSPAVGTTVRPSVGQFLRDRAGLILVLAILIIIVWMAQVQGISAQRLLSLTVRGVMLGGILALGAIGLSLIFGVLKFPNFSHGDLMSLGAYTSFLVLFLLPKGAPIGPFSFGWEFLVGLLIAMPLVGLVAFAADRILYRPLRARRSSVAILAMASLGAAFFIRSLIYLFWGADFHFYYTGRARPAIDLFLGIRVRPDQLFILALAVVLIVLIYLVLEKTKMGKAMRATADNPDLARVSGINTDKVIFWTWMIGGALAGAGGVMLGLDAQLRPEMGWWLLLPLFAAVIVGTVGNPYGALGGALVIGVTQQTSTAFMNPAYAPAVAFLIMIVVLVIKPEGLFGKPGG